MGAPRRRQARAAKPAEPAKPAESKPAEAAKPAAPAAAAQATTAPAAAAPAQPAVKSTAEIRLHVRTGNEADTLNDRLPEFEQKTGIKTKIESFPSAEYFTKLQTLIAGGTDGRRLLVDLPPGLGRIFHVERRGACRSTTWSRPTTST